MTTPPCPICGEAVCLSRDVVREPPSLSFRYWICSRCGHGFKMVDDPSRVYDVQMERAATHSLHPSAHCSRWPHRRHLVARTIERVSGTKGLFLDVGCSNGAALAALSSGWKKYGVELCPQTAEVARTYAQADVYCGPIESYHPPKDGFDVITAFALIEHLYRPKDFVQSVGSWLKPNGLLVLMTGDRESRLALRMQDEWPLLLSPDHLHFFSARSLCGLLEGAGFMIVREEWRYMYDAVPRGGLFRWIQKAMELLGCNGSPVHDHYYCYGRKRP